MSDLRSYHLELVHKFQLENPQLSVTVTTLPFPLSDFISIHICRFDNNGKIYGKLSLDTHDENFTKQLESIVKHGYNPEVKE